MCGGGGVDFPEASCAGVKFSGNVRSRYSTQFHTFMSSISYRHIVDNVTFIDSSRVAVWGWSYGGYMAARMLAEDEAQILSCAVSVAPVVKWQLYGKTFQTS